MRAGVECRGHHLFRADQTAVDATQISHVGIGGSTGLGCERGHFEVLRSRRLAAVAEEHSDPEGSVVELTPQQLEHAPALGVGELAMPRWRPDVGQEGGQPGRHVDAADAHARQRPRR